MIFWGGGRGIPNRIPLLLRELGAYVGLVYEGEGGGGKKKEGEEEGISPPFLRDDDSPPLRSLRGGGGRRGKRKKKKEAEKCNTEEEEGSREGGRETRPKSAPRKKCKKCLDTWRGCEVVVEVVQRAAYTLPYGRCVLFV